MYFSFEHLSTHLYLSFLLDLFDFWAYLLGPQNLEQFGWAYPGRHTHCPF